MCLGIAGQIVEWVAGESDLATVDVFGAKRTVNIGLLKHEGLVCGDWILIHVGHAIAKMDEKEARASQTFLQEMGQAHLNEFPLDEEQSDPFGETDARAGGEEDGK